MIRFINDILPLCAYCGGSVCLHHCCGKWNTSPAGRGVIALALLQVPIVIRTTENMLKLVPTVSREAAYALVHQSENDLAITLKASVSGIMTGILQAIAHIAGEMHRLLCLPPSNQF